jgi:hypothetical protein
VGAEEDGACDGCAVGVLEGILVGAMVGALVGSVYTVGTLVVGTVVRGVGEAVAIDGALVTAVGAPV